MGDTTTSTRDVDTRAFQPEEDDSWRLDAACIGMEDLFFVERGESTRPAKRICAGCPVAQPCLDYALDTGAHHGIWGGLAEKERRTYARKRRREAV